MKIYVTRKRHNERDWVFFSSKPKFNPDDNLKACSCALLFEAIFGIQIPSDRTIAIEVTYGTQFFCTRMEDVYVSRDREIINSSRHMHDIQWSRKYAETTLYECYCYDEFSKLTGIKLDENKHTVIDVKKIS
jgi:hypothetical protein